MAKGKGKATIFLVGFRSFTMVEMRKWGYGGGE